MTGRAALLAALLVLPLPLRAAPGAVLQIGDDALTALLQQHAQFLQDAEDQALWVGDAADRLTLARRARREVPELLATEGYFSPVLDIDSTVWPIRVKVDPGPRAQVSEFVLEFSGAIELAAFAERRAALGAAWLLPIGRSFRQRDWGSAKDTLLAQVTQRDFPWARIADSAALVDPEARTVRLRLRVDSGPSVSLGPLIVEGLERYSPELVARYNPLKRGESYSLERLLTLQSALQATPYFSAVEVELDRDDPSGARGERVPVRVRLREARPRRLSFGAGVSSNTGARVEMGYRDNDWLADLRPFDALWPDADGAGTEAHGVGALQLSSGLRLEQKGQAAFADVFLPPEPSGHRYSFGGLFEYSDISDLETSRQSLGVQRGHVRGAIETRIGLALQHEITDARGGARNDKIALAANWSWTRRKLDNLLDPRDGWVLNVQLGGGSKLLLSDENFLRLYGRTQVYVPIGTRDVLIARAEGGYTQAQQREGVPQDFLFRTGGAQTVRGYSYLGLGVRDGEATVGGRYLATASVEYDHWVSERWGLAAFVDSGNAADEIETFQLKTGVGFGARVRTPAGPIAIDLAYAVQDRKVRPHFSIAIAF